MISESRHLLAHARTITSGSCVPSSSAISVVSIRPFGLKFGARFGHAMCSYKKKVFVFGGFGELATDLNGKHLRQSAFEICDLESMKLDVIDAKASQLGRFISSKFKIIENIYFRRI